MYLYVHIFFPEWDNRIDEAEAISEENVLKNKKV